MRMDRYEEDTKEKLTRTSKNQELYTDVYLNNAYVDISDLKEVMDEEKETIEEKKVKKDEYVPYTYEEKNYDIVALIDEAIKNNSDNKVKKNIDNEYVDNIIESINEVQREKANDDTLLSDLMPDGDTEVIPGLDNPILDTSIMDTSIIHKDEMSKDLVDIEENVETKEIEENKIIEETKEIDDSFADEVPSSKKKIIFIIIGVILLIGIIIGILIWKKVIKF